MTISEGFLHLVYRYFGHDLVFYMISRRVRIQMSVPRHFNHIGTLPGSLQRVVQGFLSHIVKGVALHHHHASQFTTTRLNFLCGRSVSSCFIIQQHSRRTVDMVIFCQAGHRSSTAIRKCKWRISRAQKTMMTVQHSGRIDSLAQHLSFIYFNTIQVTKQTFFVQHCLSIHCFRTRSRFVVSFFWRFFDTLSPV